MDSGSAERPLRPLTFGSVDHGQSYGRRRVIDEVHDIDEVFQVDVLRGAVILQRTFRAYENVFGGFPRVIGDWVSLPLDKEFDATIGQFSVVRDGLEFEDVVESNVTEGGRAIIFGLPFE